VSSYHRLKFQLEDSWRWCLHFNPKEKEVKLYRQSEMKFIAEVLNRTSECVKVSFRMHFYWLFLLFFASPFSSSLTFFNFKDAQVEKKCWNFLSWCFIAFILCIANYHTRFFLFLSFWSRFFISFVHVEITLRI
jgi:hypothetical protein